MKIDDFMSLDPEPRRYASTPEMDPLTEEDASQEAQAAGVRFDALTRVVGIIFERRQALQLRKANTGVLTAHGVWERAGRVRSGMRVSVRGRSTVLCHERRVGSSA